MVVFRKERPLCQIRLSGCFCSSQCFTDSEPGSATTYCCPTRYAQPQASGGGCRSFGGWGTKEGAMDWHALRLVSEHGPLELRRRLMRTALVTAVVVLVAVISPSVVASAQ